MSKKYLQTAGLVLFFVFVFIYFIRPVGGDGDFWHHLNTGKYVLEQHRLPQTDEFTFSANGRPWVGYAWGFGVIVNVLYQNFGAYGINLFTAFMAFVAFILLYILLRLYSISRFISILTLCLAVFPIASRFPNRPELITYPFLILLFIIYKLKDTKLKFIYFIPIILFLWANMYGASVFIGLMILLFMMMEQFRKDGYTVTFIGKRLFGVGLLSVILSFINGYGLKSVFYIFFIPRIASIQGEWQGILKTLTLSPIDFLLVVQYRILIFIVFLVAWMVVFMLSVKKFRQYLFFGLLSFSVILPIGIFRLVPLVTILSVPFIALCVENSHGLKRKVYVFLLCVFCLFMLPFSLWLGKPSLGQEVDPYSPDLISFIKQNNLKGKVYNNQQIGGFLTYSLYPDSLVYTDTRDDLYLNTNVLNDFYDTFSSGESILPTLDRLKIDYVVGDLADGNSYQPLFNSDKWATVYLNDHYFISVPIKFAQEKKLPQLNALDPYSPFGYKEQQGKEAITQFENIYHLFLPSLNNDLRLATMYTGEQEYDKALFVLARIKLGSSPKRALFAENRDFLIAKIYFSKGDCLRTKQILDVISTEISGKLIFTPDKPIPSAVNRAFSFYYLVCESNIELGKKYLDMYVKQPEVNRDEINNAQKQFEGLISTLKL